METSKQVIKEKKSKAKKVVAPKLSQEFTEMVINTCKQTNPSIPENAKVIMCVDKPEDDLLLTSSIPEVKVEDTSLKLTPNEKTKLREFISEFVKEKDKLGKRILPKLYADENGLLRLKFTYNRKPLIWEINVNDKSCKIDETNSLLLSEEHWNYFKGIYDDTEPDSQELLNQ
jgi:hypothetical protein